MALVFTDMTLQLQQPLLSALLLVLLVSLAISRFFFRTKLRLPPGPVTVPIFGNWLQVGDDLNHVNLSDMARKYGEIFLLRMGRRNVVVLSSPEMAKEVLQTQGMEFGSRSANVVYGIFTGYGKDLVFSFYGDHWRKMRRIMTASFFSNKVLHQTRHIWEEEVDSAIADIKANPTSSTTGLVIRTRLQLLMYNNIYRRMFHRRFQREDDPLFLQLKRLNGERSRLAQSFDYNYGDFIPALQPFLRKFLQTCQKVSDDRLKLFKDRFLDERKQLNRLKPPSDDEKCAIDHVLEAQKNGEIHEDNVLYMIENINIAAIETTLWSLEWGIAELVNDPHLQQKVRDELNAVLGHGKLITEQDIPNLPYLHAFIKETLRLHMPIPLLLPHMNLKQEKLAGYDIPAGSKIVVNAWYLANNPEWWEKPEEFRPERFLQGTEKMEMNGNDFRFVPFGVGRRSCPGIIHAIPILFIVLGRLVQSFELLPPPGQSKVDMAGQAGQFSFKMKTHSTVVCKPLLDRATYN